MGLPTFVKNKPFIMTIKKKKPPQTWDLTRRIEVLRILQFNNYNYALTARETGVSRQTISKWNDNMGTEILAGKNKALGEAIDKVDQKVMETYPDLISLYLDAKEKAILRAMELLPKTQNLSYVGNLIKVLNDLGIPNPGSDQGKANIFDELNETLKTD